MVLCMKFEQFYTSSVWFKMPTEEKQQGLSEGMKSSPPCEYYKTVYAIRGNYHTMGMACAVKVGGQHRPGGEDDVRLVTWRGCTDKCPMPVKTVRFSTYHFGDYPLQTSVIKNSGDFSFLGVNSRIYEEKWFKFLDIKYLKEEEQKENFKVYTIHDKNCKDLQLNYNQNTKMHDLDIPDHLYELCLSGSPIIVDEKYFVGVLKESDRDRDQFIPCFIKDEAFVCVPVSIDCEAIKRRGTQRGVTEMEATSQEFQSGATALPETLNKVQTGDDAVGRNVGSESTQKVWNAMIMTMLESPQEQTDRLFQNLQKGKEYLFVNQKKGSLIITVECSSLQILDNLWSDYCKGYLDEMVQNCLVTEDILKSFGLVEVKLKTTILEKDYIACREYFLKLSEEDASTSPASPTEQETLSGGLQLGRSIKFGKQETPSDSHEEDAPDSPASPADHKTLSEMTAHLSLASAALTSPASSREQGTLPALKEEDASTSPASTTEQETSSGPSVSSTVEKPVPTDSNNEWSLLHSAAEGIKSIINKLVSDGSDINSKDSRGITPLMVAAYEGNEDAFQLLLQLKADPDLKTNIGWSLLHCAAQGGKTSIIKELISRGLEVDSKNRTNYTPLMVTALFNQPAAFHLLIEKGADYCLKNIYGDSVLHEAVIGGSTGIIEELIERDFDVDSKDCEGTTPLMVAAMRDLPAVFERLVKSGANPLLKNQNGWSLLHWAAFGGSTSMINRLVDTYGLDRNARDNEGQTPFHVAKENNHYEAMECLSL